MGANSPSYNLPVKLKYNPNSPAYNLGEDQQSTPVIEKSNYFPQSPTFDGVSFIQGNQTACSFEEED